MLVKFNPGTVARPLDAVTFTILVLERFKVSGEGMMPASWPMKSDGFVNTQLQQYKRHGACSINILVIASTFTNTGQQLTSRNIGEDFGTILRVS